MPDSWKESVVVLQLKSGKRGETGPSAFRPICLISVRNAFNMAKLGKIKERFRLMKGAVKYVGWLMNISQEGESRRGMV